MLIMQKDAQIAVYITNGIGYELQLGGIGMELKEGTSVFTAGEEEVGKISRFVLDPTTNEVTHVVVEKGWLLKEDKVVPMDMIHSATDEKAVISDGVKDFSFVKCHFSELQIFW